VSNAGGSMKVGRSRLVLNRLLGEPVYSQSKMPSLGLTPFSAVIIKSSSFWTTVCTRRPASADRTARAATYELPVKVLTSPFDSLIPISL